MRVLLGDLPSDAVTLVTQYVDSCLQDSAVVEQLRKSTLRGKVKNHGCRPDVALIVLSQDYFEHCINDASEVLSLPKTHKYINLDELNKFLVERFGCDLVNSEIDKGTKVSDTSSELVKPEEVSDTSSELVEPEEVSDTNEGVDSNTDEVSDTDEVVDSNTDEVSDLMSKLSTKDSIIANLRAQIVELNEILEVGDSTNDNSSEIDALNSELSKYKAKVEELQEQSYIQLGKVTKAEKSLNELSELQAELDSKNSELQSLKEAQETLNSDFISANNIISSLQNELAQQSDLSEKYESVNAMYEASKAENETLKEEVEALKGTNSDSEARISELEASLSNKSALEEELISVKKQLSDAELELENLGEKIGEYDALTEKYETQGMELENAIHSNESLKLELDTLKGTFEVTESDLQSALERLSTSEERVRDLSEECELKETNISEYEKKLADKEIKLLDLESDLMDVKCKLNEFTDDYNSIKALNTQLQATIDEKSALLDSYESDLNKTQLLLSEADSTVRDLQQDMAGNVFTKIGASVQPKTRLGVYLPFSLSEPDRVHIIASASSESNRGMYSEIHKIVKADSDTKYLILDLVTDTSLDIELKANSMPLPLKWLKGETSIEGYVSKTSYSNVSVVSTALSYFNEAYLLNVDWVRCVEDALSIADKVIICVGCLDNIIHNTLYCSFNKVCGGSIVLKATPVNIRTAFIHLGAFSDLSNSTVYCMDYAPKQSEKLYKKLSLSYNCCVLQKDSIITVGR